MKAAAYTAVVRLVLEYSSTDFDPHQASDVHNLEQVQRRAARFVHRTTLNEHQDVSPAWNRASDGSLYNIDVTQTIYVVSDSAWSDRCQYWLHPTIRHPYERFLTSASSSGSWRRTQVLVLSVIGIGFLPLLPMPRLSRNAGKASQASLSYSSDHTRSTSTCA